MRQDCSTLLFLDDLRSLLNIFLSPAYPAILQTIHLICTNGKLPITRIETLPDIS